MQFSTTFNAIMALALGSNAASINARQEPMVASINTYNTAECSDLPQNGIELLSESVGKCGSYEWELLGVMPYIFESNCTCMLCPSPLCQIPSSYKYNF